MSLSLSLLCVGGCDYRGLRRPSRGRHSNNLRGRPFRPNHLLPLPRQLPSQEAGESCYSPSAYMQGMLSAEAVQFSKLPHYHTYVFGLVKDNSEHPTSKSRLAQQYASSPV